MYTYIYRYIYIHIYNHDCTPIRSTIKQKMAEERCGLLLSCLEGGWFARWNLRGRRAMLSGTVIQDGVPLRPKL